MPRRARSNHSSLSRGFWDPNRFRIPDLFTHFFVGIDSIPRLIMRLNDQQQDFTIHLENRSSILNLAREIDVHLFSRPEGGSAHELFRLGASTRGFKLEEATTRRYGKTFMFRLMRQTASHSAHLQLTAELWRCAASRGHTAAMFELSVLLRNGADGVERSAVAAEKLLRNAVAYGHLDSAFELGMLLRDGGEGVEPNPAKAAEMLRDAANRGHLGSMLELGRLLQTGAEGVERNEKEAVSLFWYSARHGNSPAMLEFYSMLSQIAGGAPPNAGEATKLWEDLILYEQLETMYKTGALLLTGAEGFEPNAKEAAKLWRVAADQGHVGSMFELGMLLRNGAEGFAPNAGKAVKRWRVAADQGHVDSMFELGMLLRNGAEGFAPNAEEAVKRWRVAADQGHVDSMFELGMLLRNGAEGFAPNAEEAAKRWRVAADQGHVDSMFELGMLLRNGIDGVMSNALESKELLQRAVNRGHVVAMFELACLIEGTEVALDQKEAVALYRRAAKNGHTHAMTKMGLLLETGTIGLKPNPVEAVSFYRLAAESGSCRGSYRLGLLLEKGAEGVERNIVDARSAYRRAAELAEKVESSMAKPAGLWRKAANCGDIEAMYRYGLLLLQETGEVKGSVTKALDMLQFAADRGEVSAMFKLGLLLLEGLGDKRNVLKGISLLRDAADGGEVKSMFKLASLLLEGSLGVEQNVTEALSLLRNAVDGGEVNAMFTLGLLRQQGAEGVEPDAEEAAKLWREAADRGHLDAMFRLGLLLYEGAHGVARDPLEAVKFWRQAADLGKADAMVKLGLLLLEGEDGLERDAVQAVALLREAASIGEVDAMLRLGFLRQEGAEGIERNLAEAASLFWQAADRGDARAMVMLGLLLQEGADGVEQTAAEANFGLPLIQHDGRAGLERGMRRNACALTAYGISRICGASGVEWNVSEAITALGRAVGRGNGQAVIMMAYLMSRGKCANHELVEAMKRFELSWVTRPDPESLSILDFMDAARALLSVDIVGSRNPTLAKSLLERLLSYEPTYAPALHELAVLYEKGDEGVPKDEEKARQLYSQMVSFGDVVSLPRTESAIMKAGRNYPAVIEQILTVGKSKPRTCLLVTLGGGARGKTATVNSLRRMPFVVEHVLTEMAAFNKCVVEPGGQRRDEEEIVEIAFQDSSLRVNASRLYSISLPTEGIPSQSENFEIGPCEEFSRPRETAHKDVIERVRKSVLYDSFPQIELKGSFVQIWDMAGQTEYEMAHSMVVGRANLLVFVTNLEKVENETTRQDEVRVLCYWMQLAFLLVNSLKMTRSLIVGTRKGSCGSVEGAVSTLRSCLASNLDPKVYEAWVLEEETGDKFGSMPRIIAIENSESLGNAESSGLGQLERTLQVAAEEIMELRESVPLRWLALMEKIEQECESETRVYLSRDQVLKLSEDFPGYAGDDVEREKDVLVGLRCFASMGRLVLWEVKKEEWYVFSDVEKIVKLLGRTTAHQKQLEARLSASDLSDLAKGLISQRGLFRLWEGYNEDEKKVLLKLLCRFDLLMILQGDEDSVAKGSALIGIPAQMPYGREGIKLGQREAEEDVEVVTMFDIALPHGLIGGLMAWMHRKLVERRERDVRALIKPFPVVRANAALLMEDDGSRVVLRFEAAERALRWIFRGFAPMTLVRIYLEQLESYLRSPIRDIEVSYRHVLLAECKDENCKGTDGSRKTIEVRLKKSWVNGEDDEALMDETAFCPFCYTPWDISRMPDNSVLHAVETPKRKFDVFISHAGPDKHRMAQPLHRALEACGFHAFLDIIDLKLDQRPAPQVMMEAMGEARIGVFILSPEFAGRRWPMIELRYFLERSEKQDRTDQVALLPIFLRLDVYECRSAREKVYSENSKYHEVLKNERFFETARLKECDVEAASRALQKLSEFSGILATSAPGNVPKSDLEIMQDAAEQIVERLRPKR